MPRGVKPTTYRVACSSQLACMPRFLPAGMHATLPSSWHACHASFPCLPRHAS
jgi:hypothetical protein